MPRPSEVNRKFIPFSYYSRILLDPACPDLMAAQQQIAKLQKHLKDASTGGISLATHPLTQLAVSYFSETIPSVLVDMHTY